MDASLVPPGSIPAGGAITEAPSPAVGLLGFSYWKGTVTGTNRGTVRAWLRTVKSGRHKATIILWDDDFGPGLILADGVVTGDHFELRLRESRMTTEARPLDGHLRLAFDSSLLEAEGEWRTDIGTEGRIRMRPVRWGGLAWLASRSVASVSYCLRRLARPVYALGLVGVGIGSILGLVTPTYLGAGFLLLPAPVLFLRQIARVVQYLAIRKMGPVEFDRPQQGSAGARPAEFRGDNSTFAFLYLDQWFVPRTKMLLLWLAANGPAARDAFVDVASSLGVVDKNFHMTLNALLESGCVFFIEDRLALSALGKQYSRHLESRNTLPAGGS